MIRFFADIIYLFFFLTLTAPLYPLFDHWNKTGKAHKRSSIAQRMILRSFKICLAMAGTKLIVDGQEMVLFYMLEIIAVIMIFYAATLLLNVEWDFLPRKKWKRFLVYPTGCVLSTACF